MIRNARIYALDTGMRLGEILFLRWRDVDFEDRVSRAAKSGAKQRKRSQDFHSANLERR